MTVTIFTDSTNPLPIIFLLPNHFTVPNFRRSFGTRKCIINTVAVYVWLYTLPVIPVCECVCTIVSVSPLCMCVCLYKHTPVGRRDTWERRQRQKCLTCQSSVSYTVVLRRRRKRHLKCFHPINEEGLHLGVKSA